MTRSPIEMAMAAAQLVRKKPRTRLELAKLLGCTPTQATRYLKAMAAEGLADRKKPDWHGKSGGTADDWEWRDEQRDSNAMKCAACGEQKSKVFNTRPLMNTVWRHRECLRCGHRWWTQEAKTEHPPEALEKLSRLYMEARAPIIKAKHTSHKGPSIFKRVED